MKDRTVAFILSLALVALISPRVAEAQQPGKVYRLGWLAPIPRGGVVQQFLDRARELGWVEGQNIAIEYRLSDTPRRRGCQARTPNCSHVGATA